LRRDGYPYPMPYPSVPVDALRAGKWNFRRMFHRHFLLIRIRSFLDEWFKQKARVERTKAKQNC
jgi:hypothetical protein